MTTAAFLRTQLPDECRLPFGVVARQKIRGAIVDAIRLVKDRPPACCGTAEAKAGAQGALDARGGAVDLYGNDAVPQVLPIQGAVRLLYADSARARILATNSSLRNGFGKSSMSPKSARSIYPDMKSTFNFG